MRKATKIWLIIATSLVLIGCVLFGGVMSVLGWDFTKLSTVQYETNTYEIREAFNDLSIKTDTAHIVLAVSDDGTCRVECYEKENEKHAVMVEEGTLAIKRMDERSLYDYIGINFGSPKITVYLPTSEYASLLIRESTGDIQIPKDFNFEDVDIALSTGDVDFCASASKSVRIKTSTGDIHAENISVGSLDLSVTTGKVTATSVNCKGDLTVGVSTGKTYLTDMACQNLTSGGNTGDISLKNVIAAETFSIKRSTGDVMLDGCDAADLFVETDTGDVAGSLLSEKVFVTHTSTGRVNVPHTTSGGRCEITTDTGDITITVP